MIGILVIMSAFVIVYYCFIATQLTIGWYDGKGKHALKMDLIPFHNWIMAVVGAYKKLEG